MNKGKIKNILKKIGICAVIAFALFGFLTMYSGRVVKNISDNIVRLHVVAESNSPEDQEIKLAVRDEILAYMDDKIADVKNCRDGEELVKKSLPEIEAIARNVVDRYGKDYGVKAEYGNFSFPSKQYENIRLPAGNYNALKVTLGKGKGENWWCVLFPPLCFIDSTDGRIDEKSDAELRKALPEEEYSMITSSDENEDIPINIKFKIVDIIQESTNAIKSFITSIFG